MKKILVLILSLLLVISLFSACDNKNTTDPDEGNPGSDINNPGEDGNTPDEDGGTPDEDGNTPDEDGETPDEENPGDDTPDNGDADGENGDAEVLDGELSGIIEKIYENKPLDLPLATRDLDLSNADELKYNTGLESGDLLSAAAVSETMIGSQAYSMALVRVKDAENAQSVAEEMKNGIDTRKWICVGADDLRVVAYGDLVLLVMIDSNFADLATADELVEAFGTVCGGEFSVDLQ